MSVKSLICIECPIGCQIEVAIKDDNALCVTGNTCPRGKVYAENEVICPRRVVTSTVRADNGELLPVKTDRPVKKSEIFAIMQKINTVTCTRPIKIGDVIVENLSENVNLVATGNLK